jgi:hypothetical protein
MKNPPRKNTKPAPAPLAIVTYAQMPGVILLRRISAAGVDTAPERTLMLPRTRSGVRRACEIMAPEQ